MKESKHHHTYETLLEQIEQMIETINPSVTVNVSDITGRIKDADQNKEIIKATIMLLKKYGVGYQEENHGRSNSCPEERESDDCFC